MSVLKPKRALAVLIGTVLFQGTRPDFVRSDFNRKAIGTSSANFLKLGMGARPKAMGDQFTAVADDASAVYWNPAGLSNLSAPSLLMMHAAHVQSIFYDSFAYALPVRERLGFGMGVQYLSYGKIEQTDESGITRGDYQPQDLSIQIG